MYGVVSSKHTNLLPPVDEHGASRWGNRLLSRLQDLPEHALREILTELSNSEGISTIGHLVIDQIVNKHKPVPSYLVESVLLSPDLLPRVLLNLSINDAAARRVCKAWRSAWPAATLERAIGPKPTGRTWRNEWVDASLECDRINFKLPNRERYEAGGPRSIQAMATKHSEFIEWLVNYGWPTESAIAFALTGKTNIAICLAIQQRSSRYAATAHILYDAYMLVARRNLTAVAPHTFKHLHGKFSLSEIDMGFNVLTHPKTRPGTTILTNSFVRTEIATDLTFPDEAGFYATVFKGTVPRNDFCQSDIVCFVSRPADANGCHSPVHTSENRFVLPPLTTVTLESIHEPEGWQVNGHVIQRRLYTVSVTYQLPE